MRQREIQGPNATGKKKTTPNQHCAPSLQFVCLLWFKKLWLFSMTLIKRETATRCHSSSVGAFAKGGTAILRAFATWSKGSTREIKAL